MPTLLPFLLMALVLVLIYLGLLLLPIKSVAPRPGCAVGARGCLVR